MNTTVVLLAAFAAFGQSPAPPFPRPVRTLLITGESNHNWRYTSRLHQETLEATGRFAVDITDDPKTTLAAHADAYDLFVLDYNGSRWGDAAEHAFIGRVRGGAGVVVLHAANNAFPDWPEYAELCGLVWREGSGHGTFHAFDVEFVAAEHPISRGLRAFTAHPDELYHGLKNPSGSTFDVLARARSEKETGGSGADEPMALVHLLGLGRVFHTPLGHVWTNEESTKASIADPRLRALIARGAEWAATGAVTLPAGWTDVRTHNVLTPQEAAEGWVLLFDGSSTGHFTGYKQPAFPERGWRAVGGCLVHEKNAGGGDLVTAEQYRNFEFACDWAVEPGGNSGIMYRVSDQGDATWRTGAEMQILDNAAHADGKNARTSAGSCYALYACAFDTARPSAPGLFNHARVIAHATHVEHWLNGFKVVEYDTASPDFAELVRGSKFATMPGFATQASGRIALQDHGDTVMFRDVKIRRLPD